ncbi:synaptotagmin-2 [Aplochiton taeniatus]
MTPMKIPAGVDRFVELRMPFSDEVKFCLLAVSVTLFLAAVGILIWQAFQCCTQQKHTEPETVTGVLLFSDAKPSTSRHVCDTTPNTKVEDVVDESRRLSRCLSTRSFHSPEDSGLEEHYHPEECFRSEQQIRGSLRFSLHYDQLQSSLVVTILQAPGLWGRSHRHKPHPFVWVRLLWAGPEGDQREGREDDEDGAPLQCVLHEWRTCAVRNGSSPAFGDRFTCSVPREEELRRITLRMEVRDFDRFSRDVVLGEVRVPLGNVKISYPLELEQQLQTPCKDPVGEVLLSLKFLPTSQRLEVGLLKIRAPIERTLADTALHARVGVQCNRCKLHHQKTSSMTRRRVTVFNQALMFSLPELQIRQCSIVVSVYQSQAGSKSSQRLIGQLTLGTGRSTDNQHWNLMMNSVRQPIAQWHRLLI